MMNDYKKIELLVQVAKLYYENDYSQEMVAKKLSLSRPYISKLLNEAKEVGIVRVQVIDPMSVESKLEQKFRNKFNLKKVIITPSNADENPLSRIGMEMARYLNSIIKNGDILGLSWGDTLFECSKSLINREDLENVTAVLLCGGISDLKKNIYSTEIANNFANKLRASSYVLPLPAVVDNKKMKDIIQRDHNMGKVLQYGYDANIAVFTMGAFGLKSAIVRAGYLSDRTMEDLSQKGAVGDICSHIIDINGNICDTELDERTIAVPLDVISQKEYRIGVAQGTSKIDSICGALNGGIINVLITNEETAELVWNKIEKMERV